MTLQQLLYIIEVEKSGSLSKAASNLFVSQPNLSNSIRDLERELNIEIFKRTNRGVEISKEGEKLLTHAKQIVSQCEEIKDLSNKSQVSTLKIAAQNYSPIMEAFVEFVKNNEKQDKINFEIKNGNRYEAIQWVCNQEADIGVIIMNERNMYKMIKGFESKGLDFVSLGRLPFYVTLRKGHPALKHKEKMLSELHKYPYVGYKRRMNGEFKDNYEVGELSFINFEKEITVTDREIRTKIINETNAYGIGNKNHFNFTKNFNIVEVSMPGSYFQIGYVYNVLDNISENSYKYIEYLKEALKGIVIE